MFYVAGFFTSHTYYDAEKKSSLIFTNVIICKVMYIAFTIRLNLDVHYGNNISVVFSTFQNVYFLSSFLNWRERG